MLVGGRGPQRAVPQLVDVVARVGVAFRVVRPPGDAERAGIVVERRGRVGSRGGVVVDVDSRRAARHAAAVVENGLVQARVAVRVGVLLVVVPRGCSCRPVGLGQERIAVEGLETVHEILRRAVAAGVRVVRSGVTEVRRPGGGVDLAAAVVPGPDVFVGVFRAIEVAVPLREGNQVVTVLLGEADGFGAGIRGVLPVALAVEVVQLAGGVDEAARLEGFGGDAVRVGHVAAREVSLRAGKGIAAHLPGGHEIVVGPVEVLGAAGIGLPGRETGHVPAVIGFERLVDVGHAAEDGAEREVGESPDEMGLPDEVVLVDLLGVLHHADILDTFVRHADDAEHRVGDRTARRGGGPLGDVGAQRPGLDLLRAEPAPGVAHVGQRVPRKAAVVEVDVERVTQFDVDVVAAALLARTPFVDVVEVGLEVVPRRKHLVFVQSGFGVHVEVVAALGGDAARQQEG